MVSHAFSRLALPAMVCVALFLVGSSVWAAGDIRIDRAQIAVGESAQVSIADMNPIYKPRWMADPEGLVEFLDIRVKDSTHWVTVKALAPGRVSLTCQILSSTFNVSLTVTDSPDGNEPSGYDRIKVRATANSGLQADLARLASEVNAGQRTPAAFFEALKRAGGSMEDVLALRNRGGVRLDPTLAISLMLYEVRMGTRTPEAFYRDLGKLTVTKADGTRANATMSDVIKVRSMLVDFPASWLRNTILGQTYEAGGTKVERVVLLGRRDHTLAAINEVIQKFIDAGRIPANGGSLLVSHVGKWANQANDSLTFTGDIDFSFVSNDETLTRAMVDEFTKIIARRTGLDPKSLDSVATAHGKAGLEVYIGDHGMAFAEEQMKINELVDMTTGKRTSLGLAEVAHLLTSERALLESAGMKAHQPSKGNEIEPGLSMEMVRHFGLDIVGPKIFDVTNAVVKAAKYLDRSFQSFEKAGGKYVSPDQTKLADFAKQLTALANTKPQTLKVREDMVKLISDHLGSEPRTVWDGGTKTLKLTLDASKIAAFHEKATRALWETVKQGSISRTTDLESRFRDLEKRAGKGENVDTETAALREEAVKLVNMVEAEVKAFNEKGVGSIPAEIHSNNARVRDLMTRLSQRFGVKALNPEELKDKKFVEELLKGEAQKASEQRHKMLMAYIMDRALRAAEAPMKGVEKANQFLDIIDNNLLGRLRGDADFERLETSLKAVQSAKTKAEAQSRLAALNGYVATKIKAYNKGINEALQATALGRGSMKVMMIYGLVDEMIAYREAYSQGGWEELGVEMMRRRVPFTSAVEATVMGNYLQAGWSVVTTFIPPAALPEAAWGIGKAMGNLVVTTYWNEQLALFVDTLYKDATFTLYAIESHKDAKVGEFRLVSVRYKKKDVFLKEFADMQKTQVEALRQQISKGRLDWKAYAKVCDGITGWMDVDTVLKQNLAATDPALLLLDTMVQDVNVTPKFAERLAEKGAVRWEEVKLGFVTHLIKRLEDRKQADDALGRGILPDLFEELRKVAGELEIEDAMLKGLDAEVDTNNLKKFVSWLWDTKRAVAYQAPVESETTRAAQVVKRYLDGYKAILNARNEVVANLGPGASHDGRTRYLTSELFLTGRVEADVAVTQAWVKLVPETRTATAASLLEIKRTFLPTASLETEDESFRARLFVPELWIKPYREAAKDPRKTIVAARGVELAKTRNALLDEYRAWLKQQAPVELVVTLLDGKDPKHAFRETSGDLQPLDALGRPATGRASGNTLVFGAATGRYRLTVKAPGYRDGTQDLALGRALNPAPKVTLTLQPGSAKDPKLDPKLAAELETAVQARNWTRLVDMLDAQNRATPKKPAAAEAITNALEGLKEDQQRQLLGGMDYFKALARVDALAWEQVVTEVQRKRADVEVRCAKEATPKETPSQRIARCKAEGVAYESRCLGAQSTIHTEEQLRIAQTLQELPKALLTLPVTATFRAWYETAAKLSETYRIPLPFPNPVVPRLSYAPHCTEPNLTANKKEVLGTLKVVIEAPQATVPFGKAVTLNVTATGGKAPYTYAWSSGGSGNRVAITPSSAGEWTLVVTATDAAGRTGEGKATLRVAPEKTKMAGVDSKVTYGTRATLSIPVQKPEEPDKNPVPAAQPGTDGDLRKSNFTRTMFYGAHIVNTPDGDLPIVGGTLQYGAWGVPIAWSGDEFYYSGPESRYQPSKGDAYWTAPAGTYLLWGKVTPDGKALQSLRFILRRQNGSVLAFELRDLDLIRGDPKNFQPFMLGPTYAMQNASYTDSAGLFHTMVKMQDSKALYKGKDGYGTIPHDDKTPEAFGSVVELRPFSYTFTCFRAADLPTSQFGSLIEVRRKTAEFFQTGSKWARLRPITDEALLQINPKFVQTRLAKGQSAPPKAKTEAVVSPGAPRRRYIWQSTPGLTFAPATSTDGRTQVTYDRMGPVKLWCETQEEIGGVFRTVGEADQAHTTVIAPEFSVTFSPLEGQAKVGQDVRAHIGSNPPVADNLVDFRWSEPSSANRTERGTNARDITFKLKDGKPIVLKALARVPSLGDEIAQVGATYTGVMFQLRAYVEEPGVRPQIWDPVKKGLVNVPKGQYLVHERIPLVAKFEGVVPATVHWSWTVNEDTTLSNSTSATPSVSRSSAGSVEAKVMARSAEGALLGSAEVTVSVIEPPAAASSAKPKDHPSASAPNPGAQTQAQALVKEGSSLQEQKHYQEAIATLDKAIALNPSDPEAFRRRAMSRRELQDPQGAIADFSMVIQLDPGNSKAYAGRAITRNREGDFAGALADFTKAIDLDPQYVNALVDRGNLLFRQKDYAGALSDADRIIAINPKNVIAHNNRGAALELLKDLPGALKAYQRALDLDPNHEKAQQNRARVKALLGKQKP
jgi:Flp pilus assembly protein TadD